MQIAGTQDIPVTDEIYMATDRGAAILATSWLDDYLTAAIKSKLLNDKDTIKKLFKPSGALGSLGVKADIGFLLRLYSKKTRDDLHHIAGIRNLFAHWSKTIDFGSRDIRIACEQLTITDRIFATHFNHERKPQPFTRETARNEFLVNIGHAVTMLNWIATQPAVQDPHTKW
jgi:hypothetical protein